MATITASAPHKIEAYSILDISRWQIELQEDLDTVKIFEQNLITLPSLQRGFVWKPSQIEALWDSILRGYPIGAFLMSKSEERKDLLDGQQRCTSIALGFQDPFAEVKGFMNLKSANVPSIWIDLKPMEATNKYGLKFAVRVLSRSHPWGYQLSDHREPLSVSDRAQALRYFRKTSGNDALNFSEVELSKRIPWDSYYPVPLSLLLKADDDTFDTWRKQVYSVIKNELAGVETKYGVVSYERLEKDSLQQLFRAIQTAKGMYIPEILVEKDILAEEEIPEGEIDATLFVRLNAEGTRISGQELIYSLLKSVFPKSKELVEKIGSKYLEPSRVVNLFIRLVLIIQSEKGVFQREVTLPEFRSHLKNKLFKKKLIDLIESDESLCLMEKAVKIISNHKKALPPILYRDIITGTPDLLLVLLVYLEKTKEVNETEKIAIRRLFLQVFLFNKSNSKKIASDLFRKLNENNYNFELSVKWLLEGGSKFILPLVPPSGFKYILLNCLLPNLLTEEVSHFSNDSFIRNIIEKDDKARQLLLESLHIEEDLSEERKIIKATAYWLELSKILFWNKNFLVIAQHAYFNKEFKEYMEFEGIEDTNRPWDWDHIYPYSWVYRRRDIATVVKWFINTNGNYRALSFNENRSEGNNLSPAQRFYGKPDVHKNSFIRTSDLSHWLELTDEDKRLTKTEKKKVSHFVNAVLQRTNNIYREAYSFIDEDWN